MRDTTERPEGTDTSLIVSLVEFLLNNNAEYNKMAKAVNPYGDGHASEKIYEFILKNG